MKDTSYHGGKQESNRPNLTSLGDKLRQRVTKPLQLQLKTLMTLSEFSQDLTSPSELYYEAVGQKYAEMSPTFSKESSYVDSFQHIQPRRFEKPTRFLGIQFGKWRVFARHTFVFVAMMILIYIPCSLAAQGFYSIKSVEQTPFSYDCYGSDNGWTCKISQFFSFLSCDFITRPKLTSGFQSFLSISSLLGISISEQQRCLTLLGVRVFLILQTLCLRRKRADRSRETSSYPALLFSLETYIN
jgi:hypothetical protein